MGRKESIIGSEVVIFEFPIASLDTSAGTSGMEREGREGPNMFTIDMLIGLLELLSGKSMLLESGVFSSIIDKSISGVLVSSCGFSELTLELASDSRFS